MMLRKSSQKTIAESCRPSDEYIRSLLDRTNIDSHSPFYYVSAMLHPVQSKIGSTQIIIQHWWTHFLCIQRIGGIFASYHYNFLHTLQTNLSVRGVLMSYHNDRQKLYSDKITSNRNVRLFTHIISNAVNICIRNIFLLLFILLLFLACFAPPTVATVCHI